MHGDLPRAQQAWEGNLTAVAARIPLEEDQAGLADVLSARTTETVRDVVVEGVWPGLDVLPTAGIALSSVRDELVVAGAGREVRLREALAAVVEEYDLILIDCAPSLDQLTINALTAADGVVIVTHAKQWSLNGLAQLLETIDSVRIYYNPRLAVSGVVVNQYEDQTVSARTWLEELQQATEARGLTLLTPPVPKRVVVADATEAALGVDQWHSAEAKALGDLYAAHLTALTGGAA